MAEGTRIELRITGPDTSLRYTVKSGTTTIGRLATNDLPLDHPRVHRYHATLLVSEQVGHVVKLAGASLKVNGREIPANNPTRLHHGDMIQITPFRLVFEIIEMTAEDEAVTEILSEEDEPVRRHPQPETAEALPPGADVPAPPSSLLPPSVLSAPPPPPDYSDASIPGLDRYSVRFLDYIPGIYRTDFMSRFLAIFEAILMPIEWNIDNFDLYLAPGTAPVSFLDWMGRWFGIEFDDHWSEEKRRLFLSEAHEIYARRGTKWALTRLLEIYLGSTPEIIDDASQDPYTFTVKLPYSRRTLLGRLLEGIQRIIETNKPVHTSYKLEFGRRTRIQDIVDRL